MNGDDPLRDDLRARLETLERSATLGYLMSAVVHEINNPLSVLLIGADQLRYAPAGDPLEKGVDSLVRQAERLVEIARRLQDLVRLNVIERQPVDLAQLLERFVRFEAWACPDDPAPVLELRQPSLPADIHSELFLQACRYLARAVKLLWDGEGPVRISGSIEDLRLIAIAGMAERSPKRTYAVVRFYRGSPVSEMVSLKEIMSDFFARPRAAHEVELMAAWEIFRKVNGKMTISREPTAGIEVQVLLPLRAT